MTAVLTALRTRATFWRPIVVGALLMSYVYWIVDDRSSLTEPYSTDPRLEAALLTPNDVGTDWYRKPLREQAEAEMSACATFRLFDERELLGAANVELGQDIDGEDPRWLFQTVLVATSESLAESRMRNAAEVAQCDVQKSDGQPRFRIERFMLPGEGAETLTIRYYEIEPQEPFDRPFVAHDVMIRSGRVVATLFLGRFDRAPDEAETIAIVNRMRERVEAYVRSMEPELHATPTAATATGTLPRAELDEMLPDAADVEPLLSLIDSNVFGTEGWAFDTQLSSSTGFVVGEYRQFRSVGDFYEYVTSCAAFATAEDASNALERTTQAYLNNDGHSYSVDSVDAGQYATESEMLSGTVVRDETNYPVAIALVRSDDITCQYIGFAVRSDPRELVVDLVERVMSPEN